VNKVDHAAKKAIVGTVEGGLEAVGAVKDGAIDTVGVVTDAVVMGEVSDDATMHANGYER
jgi:hypothetical protein